MRFCVLCGVEFFLLTNSPSCNAPMVGTNPTLASGGMAFLAFLIAAIVLETAMPTLAADGIAAAAAALIFNVLSAAGGTVSAGVYVCRPKACW